MHKLLTEHPRYKKALAEVAGIKQAEARHQQKTRKAEQDYQRARDEYEQKAVEALREGRDAPPRPTPPEVDPALVQRLAIDAIKSDDLLRAAERDLAPALLPKLDARAFEIEEAIRQAADTMKAMAREASALRVTAGALRAAAEFPPLSDPGAVDVARLFDLVVHGDHLLAPQTDDDVAGFDWSVQRREEATFGPSLGGRR
jgi:hypothetical protein